MSGKTQKEGRKKARQNAEKENLAIITLYMDALCKEKLWYRVKFAWLLLRKKNPFRKFRLKTIDRMDRKTVKED